MHQTITSFEPLYAAFSAGRAMPKIHRDSLPTTLRNWKEMLSHPYTKVSRVAAQKEHDLLCKRVSELVDSGYLEQNSNSELDLPILCNNQQMLRFLN